MNQLNIDFARGEQLAIIREAEFSTMHSVSASTQKVVLWAMDELSGGRECWASIDTIAAKANVSRRQTIRAIAALVDRSVICCETRWNNAAQSKRNHYRIVWSELALLSHKARPEAKPASNEPTEAKTVEIPADHSAMVSNHSAMVSNHSAMVSNHSAMVAPNPPLSAHYPPPSAMAAAELIGNQLADIGLSQWQPLSREFVKLGPIAVSHACETYRANKSKLRPQAVVYYLRNGTWPADGITSPSEVKARQAAKATRDAQSRLESLATNIIRDMRKHRHTDESIEAELQRRGLRWP